MSEFTGTVIEEPPAGTPAHRVWQLLDLITQAERGWNALAWSISHGYSLAWNRQTKLLKDTAGKIKADSDRDCFVYSIYLAGIGGGLLGAALGGALAGAGEFTANLVASAFDDAGSQVGGTILSYFQDNVSNSVFQSPGADPTNFLTDLQSNVSTLYLGLTNAVGKVISELRSGKMPGYRAETVYQYYKDSDLLSVIPSFSDIKKRNFERESKLCLWITWGAQLDIPYWDRAWGLLKNSPNPKSFAPGYFKDIETYDFIGGELDGLSSRVKSFLHGTGMHVDVRKLRTVGMHSDITSAQTLSGYHTIPKLPMNPSAVASVLLKAPAMKRAFF